MRLNRFYIPNAAKVGEWEINDIDRVNQIKNVLRHKVGDTLIVFDGKGNEIQVKISKVGKKAIKVIVQVVTKSTSKPKKEVVLHCSILKRDNFELVVQKTTEIGITKIVPIICERTIKTGLNQDRLGKIAIEAAEQSSRGVVPEILEPVSLSKAIEDCHGLRPRNDSEVINIIFDQSGQSLGLTKRLTNQPINLFIGPEGGWTNQELQFAKENDFEIISLGSTTLRAETAAIVATFWALNK